jgi:hypothetical protein
MLWKKQRILLRAILSVTFKSKGGREVIVREHGRESLQVVKDLLREMGGA